MAKKKKKKQKNVYLTVSDPNAKAMWGRTRSQTFRDRTKYTRKQKYKNKEY